MEFQSIIDRRRDGALHTEAELRYLADGAAKHLIPDDQLIEWLKAAVENPLTPQETAWLTLAMAQSGEVLDLSSLPKPWIDKHSTGGVGDKTSIVLLPMLAACGLTVVKMSGRGLGITGGTVDKLESIPGFRMNLTPKELIAQAKRIGLAATGPTAELAPADKVLYALRDASGTVASVPLIVSSILSKKIAGGAQTVVLDVKCGHGAFMQDFDAADTLARSLKETATLCGLNLIAVITDMNQPLGRTVGNALEVMEAIEVLNGDLTTRFARLCIKLATIALVTVGYAKDEQDGEQKARELISRHLALNKAREWIGAQGGDLGVLENGAGLARAKVVQPIYYEGPRQWVACVNAQTVGQVAMDLGAGRKQKGDAIDHAVGLEVLMQVGQEVGPGQQMFRIHAQSEAEAKSAADRLKDAVGFHHEPIPEPMLVLAVV